MDAARYRRLSALFDIAVRRDGAARAAFLKHACGTDAGLRAEVESMLNADAREQPLLDQPLLLDTESAPTPPLAAGDTFGPFRLLRELGSGGMGTVWLAERVQGGFKQTVALKRVRPEFDSIGLRQRFERERRILASLEHPGIARLVDGGFDEQQHPWFAMEHVQGEPLAAYAQKHELGPRQRLRLFSEICSVLAYAHARLVIHRDLKPGNVLVTDDGHVKLLDFGIARLINDSDPMQGDGTALTRMEMVLATPDYAAPEQLGGGSVSTATDIYALGILLFELLCGCRPYSLSGRSAGGLADALARLRIPPPSKLSRQISPRILRGDLDTIVLKALATAPGDRYSSVEAFAEDIRRHLHGLPVRARRAGRGYRTLKFVRRHALGSVLTALLLLALGGGVAGTLWQAHQARQETARAQAALKRATTVQEFLLHVFAATQPLPGESGVMTQRDLADRASAQLDHMLAGQPQTRIDILIAIGRVYRKLGFAERSRSMLERAIATLDSTHAAAGDPRRIDALLALGRADYYMSDFSAAIDHLRQADTLATTNHADASRRAAILYELGSSESAALHLNDALATLARAEQVAASSPTGTGLVPRIRIERALVLRRQGELDAAIDEGEQALVAARQYYGARDVRTSEVLSTLGAMLRRAGHLRHAETLLREAVAINRHAYGQPQSAPLNNLATVLQDQGKFAESGALFRIALKTAIQRYGEDAAETASYRRNLALEQADAGELDTAELNLRAAYARFVTGYAVDTPDSLHMQEQLARVLIAHGKSAEASQILRDIFAAAAANLPANDTTLRLAHMDRARLTLQAGDTAAAQGALNAARRDLKTYSLELTDKVRLAVLSGDVARASGQFPAARTAWQSALDLARGELDPGHPLARAASKRLKADPEQLADTAPPQ